MASLYKRATPSQVRVLRIVEGSIRNAEHAHPEISLSPHHRRSIAKRAAGTLTAQWPEVLAAGQSTPSGTGAVDSSSTARRRLSDAQKAVGRGASLYGRRSPLGRLRKMITLQMWEVRRTGHPERERAFIDVLRMIAELGCPR